jgi:hypothetical protein
MTTAAYRNHLPRVRQREILTALQTPRQCSGLDSPFSGKWRRLDLAVQPNQGFVRSLDH